MTIVLVLAVIDKLDRTKLLETRTQARLAIREVNGLFSDGLTGQIPSDGGQIAVTVIVDEPDHVPLAHTDSEIIDRAVTLQGRTKSNVVVLIGDTGMAIRARYAGLNFVLVPTPDPPAKERPRRKGSPPTSQHLGKDR